MHASEIDFTGKVVLVTGGSSGIGNGIAQMFRDHGATVHVTGTRENADAYAAPSGQADGTDGSDLQGMTFHSLDLADDGAVAAFELPGSRLDVLVNSVGTVAYKRKEFELETFRRILDVNLTGIMHCCVKFHDLLATCGGCVVNLGSLASFNATRGNPAYSASKGGLRTLTMSLAEAWAGDGIRVNGVAPGFVATKITRISRDNPDIYQASLRAIPMRRWGEPREMGGVALFLASPLASYVTGQMIIVDGGMSLS